MASAKSFYKMVVMPTELYEGKSQPLKYPNCNTTKDIIMTNDPSEIEAAKQLYQCAYCVRDLKGYKVDIEENKIKLLFALSEKTTDKHMHDKIQDLACQMMEKHNENMFFIEEHLEALQQL